jgi:putative chitinase
VLATRYGSTVQAIAAANGLTNNYLIIVGQELIIPVRTPPAGPPTPTAPVVFVTATPPAPVPPLGSNNVYVVKPGDTLTRIARLFNTTVPTLAQLNGIVYVNQIQVGQQLVVPSAVSPIPATQPAPQPPPAPVIHVVRPGDTLQRIAFQYGRTVWDIARANNIQNINLIYVGQILIIP